MVVLRGLFLFLKLCVCLCLSLHRWVIFAITCHPSFFSHNFLRALKTRNLSCHICSCFLSLFHACVSSTFQDQTYPIIYISLSPTRDFSIPEPTDDLRFWGFELADGWSQVLSHPEILLPLPRSPGLCFCLRLRDEMTLSPVDFSWLTSLLNRWTPVQLLVGQGLVNTLPAAFLVSWNALIAAFWFSSFLVGKLSVCKSMYWYFKLCFFVLSQ